MPPPPRPNPPNHVARLAINGKNDGIPWANVFWVRNANASTPNQSDLFSMAGFMLGFYQSRFKGLLSTTISIEGAVVLYYLPNGDVIGAEKIDPVNGIDTGAVMPAQASCCISWTIQQRYRGGHPRTYLPPGPQDELLGANQWQNTYVSEVTSSANSFHSDVNGFSLGELRDLHLGTVSFVKAKQWRNPPVFRDYTPNSAVVDKRVDTQRRRLGPDL